MKGAVVGVFVGLVVVLFLFFLLSGAILCTRALGPFHSSPPEYSFDIEGDQLSVVNMYGPPKFNLIKRPTSPVKVEEYNEGSGSVLGITYRGKTHWRRLANGGGAAFWSTKRQAVYFTATVASKRPANTFPKGEIWKWTPKGGFVRTLQIATPLTLFSESLDGNYLFGHTAGSNSKYENQILTYSFQTKEVKYLKVNAAWAARYMISPTKFLDNDGGLINTETNIVEKIPFSTCAAGAVAYEGSVWVIHEQDNLYEVVRLSPDLKKVEQVFPFPKNFPRKGPSYE